jgi:CubicO group peptidase (beta-lactamase class C family)
MSRLARLDGEAYRTWLAEEGFSGIVHVVGDDEPSLTITLGLADRVAGLPIHAGTRFAIASTAKMLTGLAVARLTERGALRYDDRYVDLVGPDLRPRHLDPRVTIAHLLSHTSGVGDYADEYDGPPFEQIWETTPPGRIRGPKDTLELMRDLPRTGEPGGPARYSNGGYILVGIALEEVTGRPFPDVVQAEVFEPLGMRASGYWPLDGLEPNVAIGYLPPDEEATPGSLAVAWRTNVYSVPALGGPDGGAQATAADLVRALDGLTGRGPVGGPFLSDATRTRMTTVAAISPVEKAGYGLGMNRVGDGSTARVGHAGEDPGASSRCWAYDLGERVVVLSNTTEGAWQPFRRLDELLAASTT